LRRLELKRQFSVPPELSSELVVLKPLTETHITDEYLKWLADYEVIRYLDIRFHQPQTFQDLIEYVRSFYDETECYAWAIYLKITGLMVGTVTIPRVDRINLTAGIGLMIGDRSAWGTGAGPQALDLVIEFAFQSLGLNRLAEHNVANNHQSNFMLRRAGFRHEGTLKDAYRATLDGDEWFDGYDFALLADEWRAKKAKTKTLSP
jgi:[ribosomal protein S5]-alanine N-acetyltransferase